jgi:hypothetical protein
VVDLGHDADVARRQPLPRSHHWNAAIISVPGHIDSGPSRNRFGHCVRHRQLMPPCTRAKTVRDIAARIAHQQLKNRTRVLLIRQQPQEYQAVVEPAFRNHAAGFIEGIRFPGVTIPAERHDAAELFSRIDP